MSCKNSGVFDHQQTPDVNQLVCTTEKNIWNKNEDELPEANKQFELMIIDCMRAFTFMMLFFLFLVLLNNITNNNRQFIQQKMLKTLYLLRLLLSHEMT